jgi:hypothetical protein
MGKTRAGHEEKVQRANPLVVFATAIGLLSLLIVVVAVIWVALARTIFAPKPREVLSKNIQLLRSGMTKQEVQQRLGAPREQSAKELVTLLGRSRLDLARITLTESPHFQADARQWQAPVNRTYTFITTEDGPETKGNLYLRESQLTFDKNGKWTFDLGVLMTPDGKPIAPAPKKGAPAPGPEGGPSKSALLRKRPDNWAYFFRGVQRPKSDEGPVQFLVLITFEDGVATSVLRAEVDLQGLPKPGGGTFEK